MANGNDDQVQGSSSEDYMFNYHTSKLVFGLTLFEYHDSIKEGDGERLLDLYRLLLLLFKANHKTKYAYACLLYLVQLEAILSESDAHNLKWNRFFSKYGGKGANIPLDLRMEQYNKIVKTMWRSLGANLTEESASRLANTVEPVEIILDRVDEDCGLKATKGYRSKGKPEEAVAQITKDLMQIKAFQHHPGREGHPSFPKFPSSLLNGLDYRDLREWMVDLFQTWEPIYTPDVE